MKQKTFLRILAWIALILLFPLMLVGSVAAIAVFTIMLSFKYTAKLLSAWADAI